MEEARPEAWPVAQGYGLELVAFHRSFRLLENVLALILIHLRNDACILLLDPKVVLDQVKGLLVYLLVLVALQELNLVQACVGTSLKQSYKHMNKQHDKHSLHERKAYDNSDNNNNKKKKTASAKSTIFITIMMLYLINTNQKIIIRLIRNCGNQLKNNITSICSRLLY